MIGAPHHHEHQMEQQAHLAELLALNDFRGHVGVRALQRLLRDHVLDAAHAKVRDLGGEAVRLLRVGAQQDITCNNSPVFSTRPAADVACRGFCCS